METAIQNTRNPKRILVIKLGSMGDIVHCLPSVRQLRDHFPDAEIDWLVERRNKAVLDMGGLSVRVVPIDTYQWRHSPGIGSAREIVEFLWELRSDGYDCAIDFQGLLKSAFVGYMSSAPIRIGWERDFLREPASRFFYTDVVTPRRVHVIDRQMELLQPLGIDPDWDTPPRIAPPAPARASVERKVGGRRGFVLLNAGANWRTKRWDPARFGELARRLIDDGLPVALTWGPGEEDTARSIRAVAGAELMAIDSTLTELAALCERARLFVGGDTGPMHVAAAVGTPVVSIFGPTSSDRNGPFLREDAVVELKLPCRPCYVRDACPLGHLECMVLVTVDAVYEACRGRLDLDAAARPAR